MCCDKCRFGWDTCSFSYRHGAGPQTGSFTAVSSPEQVAFTLPSPLKIKSLHFKSYCCQCKKINPYKTVYCHLQGQKGEQGTPGLAGRQGVKVLSNSFVTAFEDEDKLCLGVMI